MTAGQKWRRTGIIAASALAAVIASACAPQERPPLPDNPRAAPILPAPRPDYPGYGSAAGVQALPWSRASLAEDFIALNFEGEGNIRFERLIRWEGPVRVALAGPEINAYRAEVSALIARIRVAAPDLDILLSNESEGEITLRTAPRDRMQAFARGALCFIAPTRLPWDGYVAETRAGNALWTDIKRFEAMSIFIPEGAAPHVFRSCIAEELTQALGPLNDLYLLEDSGFNDDEAHLAPTRFDYMMLTLLYAPELSEGITGDEARAAALAALARIGHQGRRARPRGEANERFERAFIAARKAPPAKALAASERAVEVARQLPRGDHRLGAALRHLMLVQIRLGARDAALLTAKEALGEMMAYLSPLSPRLARMRADAAFLRLSLGDAAGAIPLLEEAEPVLAAHKLDAALAVSLHLRAIALALTGQSSAGAEPARDALAWAGYVFGANSLAVADWRATFRQLQIPL